MCSVSANDEPRDPVNVSPRPLKREAVMDIDPVNVLKSDVCLLNVEAVPIEAANITEFPRATNVVMIRDPVRLLANPLISELAKERVPVRVLARPLVSKPVREIEPVNILDSERCLATPEDMVRDPVRALSNDT